MPISGEVSILGRFRRLHAGDRGLIAAPWTPLASLCCRRGRHSAWPRSGQFHSHDSPMSPELKQERFLEVEWIHVASFIGPIRAGNGPDSRRIGRHVPTPSSDDVTHGYVETAIEG